MDKNQNDFVILGAGVTGLAAGSRLKSQATVLERDEKPGGLVKTHRVHGEYWFDHVLHLLHFKDAGIQSQILHLMGDVLQPCCPVAWIDSEDGHVLYPFQLNLGALNEKARNSCIIDFAKAYFDKTIDQHATDYKQYLLNAFGASMCELFYFPYNEKLYKYPLEKMVADSIRWNLHRPSFEEILTGSFYPNQIREAYNSNAFYPVPPKGAPQRGMELLAQSLAACVPDLRLGVEVVGIEVKSKAIHYVKEGRPFSIGFRSGCMSTIPLPALVRLCKDVPTTLKSAAASLEYTKVYSVALCIKGKRPKETGHWRYFTDRSLPFTRLVFMTAFDPYSAPEDGWGLLAEVTCAGNMTIDRSDLIRSTVDGIKKAGYFGEGQKIEFIETWLVDPAYVVFTPRTSKIIMECVTFFNQNGIELGGRYGKWEYSSMYQNIKDGFDWAQRVTQPILINQ